MSKDIRKWSNGRYTLMFDEHTFFVWDNENDERMTALQTTKRLNKQQELIEELQVSDEMGWKRAEHFEKKCPKELHNKKMYIKRLEYKVQKFKEENEQLRRLFEEMKQPITINLTEEDEKELRKLLGLIDDE